MGGSIYGTYVGDLKCWPFSPPQRLKGVLLVGFEYSQFYPQATTVKQAQSVKNPAIWFEPDAIFPLPFKQSEMSLPHAYLIDAEGRLSLCDAWFGHQGGYPREFIVSKYYAASALPLH